MKTIPLLVLTAVVLFACNKTDDINAPIIDPLTFSLKSVSINGQADTVLYDVPVRPEVVLHLSSPVNKTTVDAGIVLKDSDGDAVPLTFDFLPGDSVLIIHPTDSLKHLAIYRLLFTRQLSSGSTTLQNPGSIQIHTSIDSTFKRPLSTDEQILDTFQLHALNSFWLIHTQSGMATERATSVVTTGGTGFGVMALLAGVKRNFVTRDQALQRLLTLTNFLENKAPRFKGAFAHWMDDASGSVLPFSEKDDGADLVETAFLMQGLLTAKQFFNASTSEETNLRNAITRLYNAVEWSNFIPQGENVLYWHWSPTHEFEMNLPISGWNEALIVYVLAAGSPTFPISKSVYENGWARNGAIKNNNEYYGVSLPLGEPFGGPMFYSHYSFLGLDPNGLTDQYADYEEQVKAHAQIQYKYAQQNPLKHFGYSPTVWGLSASDDYTGYRVHSPTSDNGVIATSAAIASLPFSPEESMQAIRFDYYILGDKLIDPLGIAGAFSLKDAYFTSPYLAIDQGPMVVMIENYRSKMLWQLFMSDPAVRKGLADLGFSSPYL